MNLKGRFVNPRAREVCCSSFVLRNRITAAPNGKIPAWINRRAIPRVVMLIILEEIDFPLYRPIPIARATKRDQGRKRIILARPLAG